MEGKTFILDPRDWIIPPFTSCPFCGGTKFGTLMVNRRGYVKRCRDCMQDESYPLPSLEKKVLYLDQFAISNLMKVVHPDHRARLRRRGEQEELFWLELFDRIERLVKLHVLVCPWSNAHWEESFVAAQFEDIRRVYEHLAGDVRLEDPPTLKRWQIMDAFRRWLDPGADSEGPTRRRVLEGNVDGWMDRLQLHARLDPEADVAEQLRAARGRRHDGLAQTVAAWRAGPRRSFDEFFAHELAGYGEYELGAYAQRLQAFVDVYEGRRLPDEDFISPSSSQILIQMMRKHLDEHGVQHDEHLETIRKFFDSENLRQVPFVRISAGMLAAYAVKASLQQAPDPDRGLVTDVNVVSLYLPYCDGFFIDRRCADLFYEADGKLDFGYTVDIFTPRSRDRLLDWLDALESAVHQEHRDLVMKVYGPAWLDGYRDILVTGAE